MPAAQQTSEQGRRTSRILRLQKIFGPDELIPIGKSQFTTTMSGGRAVLNLSPARWGFGGWSSSISPRGRAASSNARSKTS